MKFLSLITAAALLMTSMPAMADSDRLPDGVTTMNISVTEREKVEEDMIIANLQYEAKGDKAATVQDEINKAMTKALASVKKDKDIEVSTESYRVYMSERYEKRGDKKIKIDEWRGSQSITMKSENFEAIQKLTGELQGAGFSTSGFSYTLSPEKQRSVRETLLKGAVDKLKKQSSEAAMLLSKKSYEIREINIDGGGYYPRPMMRAMAMDMAESKIAAPVAEGGEQEVTLTVNARVELK